jgi:ABC-type multidrug transport system ATPase subunit
MSLTITGLSKVYPKGVQALKNISLAIGNHMFGQLGPNGAGKSTLMRTIATLQEPDSEIRVYADGSPGDGFGAVDAGLEDVYFLNLSKPAVPQSVH